jgi:hypothetical protein
LRSLCQDTQEPIVIIIILVVVVAIVVNSINISYCTGSSVIMSSIAIEGA